MELSQHLSELLSVREPDALFVTAYLDTTVGPMGFRTFAVFLRKRVSHQERLVQLRRGGAAVREFRRNICRIDEFLTYKLSPETRGCALFSGIELDYFKAIQFPVAVPNRLSVSNSPNLDPLIELHQNTRHYAVVALDQQSGRIFSIFTSGTASQAHEVKGDIPGRSRAGGWSQMRFQRRRQELIDQFMRHLGERLDRFLDRKRPLGVILLGTQENLSECMRHLPTQSMRRILITSSIPAPDSEESILEKAHTLIEEYEQEREGRLIAQLYDRLCNDYRSVVGQEETLFELQVGRLERLFIGPSFQGEGVRCRSCSFCYSEKKERCTYCHGELESVDLRDQLERLAAEKQVPLEIVGETSFLDSIGGAGAFLRF